MTTISPTRRELITSMCSAQFAVRNLGLNTVTGTVPIVSGWVEVDAAGAPLAVHASLDLGSLATGNARRDRDLRKPSLLDLDRYPTLLFTGRPLAADQGWSVRGTLEAHGASTPITLAAATVECTGGSTTVQAHGEFDRRDLAVHAPRIMIGRRIRVRLELTLGPTRPTISPSAQASP